MSVQKTRILKAMELGTKIALGVGICALFCVLPGWLLTKVYWDHPQASAILDSELAKAKELGLPMVKEEMDTTPEPPADRNAATEIAQWHEKFGQITAERDLKLLIEGNLATLRRAQVRYAPFLAEIDRATDKGQYKMDLDYDLGVDLTFHHLGPLMESAYVLRNRGIIQARSGDITGTLEDLERINTMGRFAGSEPHFPAALTSLAIATIRDYFVENVVDIWKDNPAALERLEKVYTSTRFRLEPSYGIRGEFYMFLTTVRNPDTQHRDLTKPLSPEAQAVIQKTRSLVRSGLPTSLAQRAYLARGMQYHLEVYPLFKGFFEDPHTYGKQIETITQSYTRNSQASYRLARALLPSFTEVLDAYGDVLARERAIIGLIRATQIHVKTGTWPTSLAPLKLEKDPWTQEDLKIIRKGDAFRIYSVGNNITDDGGTANTEVPMDNPNFDIVASSPPTPIIRPGSTTTP